MTAERAIELLKDISRGYDVDTVGVAVEMAIKALERQRWIPVSERLPDDPRSVLVTLGYTYTSEYDAGYSIARYINFDDGECHWCDDRRGYLEWEKYSDGHGGNSSYKVIAWQPLPEPYKGE